MQLIAYAILFVLLALPGAAQAYVGPGLGLGAVGMILAVIFSGFLAVVGLIWYPFKRLIRSFKKKKSADAPAKPNAGSPQANG